MNHYHDNLRPEFSAPATWSAIQQAWETLRAGTFADEGDYSCRHSYHYILNLIALRMRPDLKENAQGNLVPA